MKTAEDIILDKNSDIVHVTRTQTVSEAIDLMNKNKIGAILVKEGDDFAVLTDILGDEDHLGDMDFKVAGTDGGITALQMDIKIQGITKEIMNTALGQAKDARLHPGRNELGDFRTARRDV